MSSRLDILKLRILNGVNVVLGKAKAHADINALEQADEKVYKAGLHMTQMLIDRFTSAREANAKALKESEIANNQKQKSILYISNPTKEMLQHSEGKTKSL